MDDQAEMGIEARLWFFPLAFFFFACTPRIEIDGEIYKRYWGTHFFDVAPGRHKVTIYFPYIFMSRCGESSVCASLTSPIHRQSTSNGRLTENQDSSGHLGNHYHKGRRSFETRRRREWPEEHRVTGSQRPRCRHSARNLSMVSPARS